MSFYSKYAGEEVEQRLDAVSEIAGQVGDISGALSEVSGKVGEVSEHLASVDASVVAVGNKVDGVVASVDGVSSRVDANATNIAEVAEKVGSIEKDVDVIDESVGALGERVQELGSLTTSVENLSANVTAIGRGVEQLAERVENVASELDNKQGVLESGVNIKTINGESILGAGDIKVQGGGIGGDVEDVTEIQGNEFVLLMDGDKVLRVPMSVLKAWLGVPSEPSEPDQPDEPTTPDVDENGYIVFADAEVQRVLMANGVSSDGVGITLADAEKVTDIGIWFKGNTVIESFDEFEKFTGVTFLGTSTNQTSYGAFNGCTSLQSIKLPPSVTHLRPGAFYNCTSLEIEDLSLPNLETLGQNAFYGVKIKKISDLGKITALPTASTSTQNFGDKSVLEEVVLPIGITNIGVYAFMNYTLLTGDFNLLSVTTIGGSAFQNTAITSIMLPLVNTISWNAFTDCKKLKFVKIGDSIGKIDAAAFQNCISLENVIIENATPPTLSGTSFTNTNNCLIYVPDASVEAYKTATNWSTYASRIKGISELQTDNAELYEEIKDYLG